MDSKGALTEDGYTVEAAIPFKSLRYEAGKNKQWGIHIYRRVKYNNNELDSWMRNNRSVSGSLTQAGHITGLEDISTTRQIEINPSFTVSQTGRRTRFTLDQNPAGRFVNDGIKGEFGMTAKFGLTPTITLDFAYNPDFAQVEADAPVSTANVRFPIFFQEKRPFFLERIDIFRSGLNVVNTRAIVDPDIAAKLTGRRGKNTFGIMYASDNAPGNYSKDERQSLAQCRIARLTDADRVCGIDRFVDKNADIGVLRFKRDIGRENSLGMFATTYNFVDRHNNTGGFDGRFRLDPKTVIEFQAIGTTTRGNFYDPDLDRSLYRTGNGLGYRVFLERSGRNLYMNYMLQGRSANYRADVGFTDRVDTNYAGSFIRYQTDSNAKKAIINKRIQTSTNVSFDWKGRAQYFFNDVQGQLALQKQTYIGLDVQYGFERVYENEFGANRNAVRPGAFFGPRPERGNDFKAMQAYIETTPNKQFYIYVFMDYTAGIMEYDFGAGHAFPRASAAYVSYLEQLQQCSVPAPPAFCNGLEAPGLDPGPGDQLTLQSTIRYQPTSAFQTKLDYTKRRLVRNDTHRVAFDDNLFSWRSTYQFTRNTFARLRLDYSSLNRHVRPQLVVGWTPSPGTAIYLGYNDDVSYNGYNPYTGRFEPGLRGNGRSFFIKASYLFKRSF
jgi:outer membrane scaffolding protein for murein synthesis (MipA/OmpV family)